MATVPTDQQTAPSVPDNASPEDKTNGKRRGRPKADKKPYRQEGDPLLEDWPVDFDRSLHEPLSVEDFSAQDKYWDHKADVYRKRMEECMREAELFRKFGSSEKRKQVSKLQKLQQNIAELRASLEADGDIDVDDLLAEIG